MIQSSVMLGEAVGLRKPSASRWAPTAAAVLAHIDLSSPSTTLSRLAFPACRTDATRLPMLSRA